MSPKHCRKLISPKAPPMTAPPGTPRAMAAMATGIILKVMESPAGWGMFTMPSTTRSAVSRPSRVSFFTMLFLDCPFIVSSSVQVRF